MNHETTVRKESSGITQVEYRVICTCGWQEKAMSRTSAELRGNAHIIKRLT